MPRTFVPKGTIMTDRTALEQAFNYRVEKGCSIRAVILDDSSDFSEDLTEEMEPEAYPFVEKEPEVRDFFTFSYVITA